MENLKIKIALVICIFCATILDFQAQGILSDFYSMPLKYNNNSLQLNLNAELGSTTLSTSFIKKYFANGFITDSDKLRIKESATTLERFGFESSYGTSYFFKPDSCFKLKNKFYYNLNFENKNMLGAVANSDVVSSIFLGNTKFIGDTNGLNLQPLNFQLFDFQKFGFGLGYSFEKDSAFIDIFLRASYINAKNYSELIMNKSKLLFSDSTYATKGNIDFIHNTSQANSQYFSSVGKGAALDFGFSYKTSNTTFTFMANDFGFVKYNKISQLKIDTSFVFKGYDIDMQRLINDSLYKLSLDSLLNVSSYKKQVSKYVNLPYTLRLNTSYVWNNSKFITTLSFTFKNLVGFNPRVLLAHLYNLKSKYAFGVYIANGGFAQNQYGLIGCYTSNKFIFKVSLHNPVNIFINKSAPVAGLNVLFVYCW